MRGSATLHGYRFGAIVDNRRRRMCQVCAYHFADHKSQINRPVVGYTRFVHNLTFLVGSEVLIFALGAPHAAFFTYAVTGICHAGGICH